MPISAARISRDEPAAPRSSDLVKRAGGCFSYVAVNSDRPAAVGQFQGRGTRPVDEPGVAERVPVNHAHRLVGKLRRRAVRRVAQSSADIAFRLLLCERADFVADRHALPHLPQRARVDSLIAQGVRFSVCMNTVETVERETPACLAISSSVNGMMME